MAAPASSPASLLDATPCRRPHFSTKHVTVGGTAERYISLKNDSALVVVRKVLSKEQRDAYVAEAQQVQRRSHSAGHGATTPREEVCYTPDGLPYVYSGKRHLTTKYPEHVKTILPLLLAHFEAGLPAEDGENAYRRVSSGVDILYSDKFDRGGSIGRHRDDEHPGWGLVLIYSIGQARWLRVRDANSGQFYNVEMTDNSLVAMYGERFKADHTHQVDKLHKDEEVGARNSLNIRFLLGNTQTL